MRIMRRIILLIFWITSSCFLSAQIDTNLTSSNIDFKEFESYTDSLLYLWYKQNVTFNKELEQDFFKNDTTFAPFFSDEVLSMQLNRMNTYIEMTFNNITKQYIDFYAYKRRNLVSYMIGNSEYYFPFFEEALDRYGLPLELKYLPVIESALNPRAYSRARAVGLWQFILPTGKLYKLNITSLIDERMDVIKASDAAARYLRDLYNVFQDWHLAIAAYNCGPGNINRAIKRSGKTTYWEIYNYLPRETRGYVPAFIGAAYTFHYYKELNIIPRKTYMPIVDTIYVNKMLHLKQVSELLNIPLELLQLINPQYVKDIIPALPEQPLPLYLPIEYITSFMALGDSVYKYKDTLFFKTIRPSLYILPSNNNYETVAIYHKVKKGETLSSIAKKYHVSVSDLRSWNNIKSKRSIIRAGQNLVLFVVKKKKTKITNNQTKITNLDSLNKVTIATSIDSLSVKKPLIHIVKQGDTLYSIAKLYNVSIDQLCKSNNISTNYPIKVGQKLIIIKPHN